MDADARQKLFYTLVLAWFLAGLGLRFLAGGMLRGSLYDIVLVAVLASATFSTRNFRLLKSPEATDDMGLVRRRQVVLNRTSVIAWAGIAMGAEIIQGLLRAVTGKDALGTFDTMDTACYIAGALASFLVNRLLYVDVAVSRGRVG
ncbi:MAG: hypothetical protein IPO18_05485 [bacterium]|nr:hypothetical protein [bacterium]